MEASASFLVLGLGLGLAALATVSCKEKGAADGANAEATAAGSAAASSAPVAAPAAPKDITVDELRHAHVAVDIARRDAWLRCMNAALDDPSIDDDVRGYLRRRFAEVADFLRNRPEE